MDRKARLMSLFGLTVGILAVTGSAAVAQSQHLTEAITHVQAAVAQGKQGYPDALATQAKEALKHVELARGNAANLHLDEVVRLLKDAITHAKQGRTEQATTAAEQALIHLTPVAPGAPEVSSGCGY
ncbi:small metal-binding protein SmbP [Nitrospira sp. Kam-Ns4a]